MNLYHKYEVVIGLDMHAQLLSKTKAYSEDVTAYSGEQHTFVSPVTLSHTGTLPVFNQENLLPVINLGLVTNGKTAGCNKFDHENDFYADLPKVYQITQGITPNCTNGQVLIGEYGIEKTIRIQRIEMEAEDGESIHDLDPVYTLFDLNRPGTPTNGKKGLFRFLMGEVMMLSKEKPDPELHSKIFEAKFIN